MAATDEHGRVLPNYIENPKYLRNRITELEQQLAEARKELIERHGKILDLEAASVISDLAIESLKKDAERLDWIKGMTFEEVSRAKKLLEIEKRHAFDAEYAIWRDANGPGR